MAIYTRTGDDGSTGRAGGQRVRKSDPGVAAGGEIDELNSHVGLCRAACGAAQQAAVRDALEPVQAELMAAGALLAAAGTDERPDVTLDDASVSRMERRIDEVSAALPELKHLVFPAGCELAVRLHAARTVCRRAERAVVAAADADCSVPPILLRYLNRLSDLLFALSRLANVNARESEVIWRPQDRR